MKLRLIALLTAVFLLWGCSPKSPSDPTEPTQPTPPLIGISMPGRSGNYRSQTAALTAALEAKGYRVQFEYCSGDTLLQQSQVQGLINMPVDCLVIAAYDPLTLSAILQDADMPILAYDRMLRFCTGVSGCVAADYYDAGQQIALYALSRYGTETRETPLTVEFLMGPPQDPNSVEFHRGVMSVLQPHLDSGALVCLSGNTLFEDVCLTGGTLEEGRDLCFDFLSDQYENTFPDILIGGNDAIAEGCTEALKGMAFSPEEAWPVVTGLGGTEDGLALLENGMLSVTAATDEARLVEQLVLWVTALLEGTPLPENTPIHNGAEEVPSVLPKMHLITPNLG